MNNYNKDNNDDTTKSNSFIKGMVFGLVFATVVSLSTVFLTFAYHVKKGNVLFSDGRLIISGNSGDSSNGIGSSVERKLNLISQLMDEEFYFEIPKDNEAADAIIKAYLETFDDKYTEYYTAEEYEKLFAATEGIFYGIGATCVKDEDGSIAIKEVIDNSPAMKAGIKSDDRIIKVDGTDIRALSLQESLNLVKGEKDTKVSLEIIRGNETLLIDVIRGAVDAITVNYAMTKDNIGYIRVKEFAQVTPEQFKKALDDLEKQGAKAIIIDVRNNPGGSLSSVCQMLGMICPDGLLVYNEDKNGNKFNEITNEDGEELTLPLAVLVNENSASASELFSGAIQDYNKGKIIGTQTFGKGIMQTIKKFNDGSAIKYTKAKYFTPKGQDIHGVGVKQDIIVELPTDATSDTQFEAAMEYLLKQINN